MEQVCWSPILHAGLPPINTVVHAAPTSGDPCIVESPSLAAGRPTLVLPSLNAFHTKQAFTQNSWRVAGIDILKTL
jgi:hypothetical protein